ncbi:MAG: rhodanese-like domain-containing protein [Steroidobacteraceae bacterium]
MRSLLLVATLIASVAVADDAAKIEPNALAARIKQHDTSLVILDVRSQQEFASGHIPGAINIPYDQLPARIVELPNASSQEFVLYCVTGQRTQMAIDRLREQGYSHLLHLRGDFQQWQASGLPQQR